MAKIKIFRFSGEPSQRADCWQRFIISNCNMPAFDSDISYVLNNLPRWERQYWRFGFTKAQFVKACRTFKPSVKYFSDKSLLKWNPNCPLMTDYIDEKYIWEFDDQVIFDVRHSLLY